MANLPSAGTPVLNAVTATTSKVINTENLDGLCFQFTAAAITSGNGVLTVLASNDGANFYGIAFVDGASTTLTTAIVSKTLSSNTTFMGFLPAAAYKMLKFTLTFTTDGNYTVWCVGNTRR